MLERRGKDGLKPCPFCGSSLIRPFYDAKDLCITGLYCYGCGLKAKWDIKADKYLADVIDENSFVGSMDAWRDKWNARSN